MLEYMLASGERHLITDEELAVIEAAKACVGASGDWGRKLTP